MWYELAKRVIQMATTREIVCPQVLLSKTVRNEQTLESQAGE